MKTNQIMKREFMGKEIRQQHIGGFFCINDLTAVGNCHRKSVGLPLARWDVYKKSAKTKEFIESLIKNEQIVEVVKSTRGRGSLTWVHPLIFFDYAMWLSPDFKVAVYKWLYENLTVFRDDSGESYKKMCKVLSETQNYTPTQCATVIPQLAKAIKRDVCCDDWNKATPEQLKKRDDIHKKMVFALKMGVDPQMAYKTIMEDLLHVD